MQSHKLSLSMENPASIKNVVDASSGLEIDGMATDFTRRLLKLATLDTESTDKEVVEECARIVMEQLGVPAVISDLATKYSQLAKRLARARAIFRYAEAHIISFSATTGKDLANILGPEGAQQTAPLTEAAIKAIWAGICMNMHNRPPSTLTMFIRDTVPQLLDHLMGALDAICNVFANPTESRARTLVEAILMSFNRLLQSLDRRLLLYPELPIATKEEGSAEILANGHIYFVSGTVDILIVTASTSERERGATAGTTHAKDPRSAVNFEQVQSSLGNGADSRIVRYVPCELKRQGVNLKDFLPQIFFETCASMSMSNLGLRKVGCMAWVLTDGCEWLMGTVKLNPQADGSAIYELLHLPVRIIDYEQDFKRPLEELLKMLTIWMVGNPSSLHQQLKSNCLPK